MPALYPLDPSRLVLVGFSQGAMVGNALALTRPGLLCGVASLAGAIPPLPPEASPSFLPVEFPVFIAHGVRDETVPLRAARQTREAFRRLGARVTYGEYSVGHKMNTPAMNDLRAWLAEVLSGR
ncbi:MAG: hypothetical protein D6796_09180 [Caldilineae bacterium]|nr:MAG: hypothetical protein D6796_09180 [Caldilineae bacterium]